MYNTLVQSLICHRHPTNVVLIDSELNPIIHSLPHPKVVLKVRRHVKMLCKLQSSLYMCGVSTGALATSLKSTYLHASQAGVEDRNQDRCTC